MTNAISVIIIAIIFGGSLIFANIHTIKNFKKNKDFLFLMTLIIADISFLSVYIPAAVVVIASLL